MAKKIDLDTMTLAEAREYLKNNFKTRGSRCPCCEQLVKLYLRKLTATHGYVLLLMYRYFVQHPDAEWLQLPKFMSENLPKHLQAFARGGDYAKLKYWNLIEAKVEKRADGSKRNGYFRITDAGVLFAKGQSKIPWACWVYNARVHKMDDSQMVTIHQILNKKFDYTALMNTPMMTGYRGP